MRLNIDSPCNSIFMLLVAFFLMTCDAFGQGTWVPIGTHTKFNAVLDKTMIQAGGPPHSYLDGNTWRLIELNWVQVSNNFENTTNLHTNRINSSTHNIKYKIGGHTLKQKPYGVFAYYALTDSLVTFDDSPDYSNVSLMDSILTYANIFPDIDLRVINRVGSISLHWVFHQAARDSFNVWWVSNGSPSDVYWSVASHFNDTNIGSGISYRDSIGAKTLTQDFDVVGVMDFIENGKSVFHSPPEWLDQFIPAMSNEDIGTDWPVYKRMINISGKIYIFESVKWSDALQVPPGDISHDSEFGYHTIYSTNATISNRQRGVTATPSSSGTMDSLTFYTATGGGTLAHASLYNSAGTTLLDSSDEATTVNGGWNSEAVVIGASIVAGTEYLLYCWGNGRVTKAGAEIGATRYTNVSQTYGAWPSTIGKNNATANEAISIYAVFTVSGGAPEVLFRRRRRTR